MESRSTRLCGDFPLVPFFKMYVVVGRRREVKLPTFKVVFHWTTRGSYLQLQFPALILLIILIFMMHFSSTQNTLQDTLYQGWVPSGRKTECFVEFSSVRFSCKDSVDLIRYIIPGLIIANKYVW